MPGGDGTGPFGTGGRCTPYIGGGIRRLNACWGLRRGRGMRLGLGRRFFINPTAPISREEEIKLLEEEAKLLEAQTTEIKKRIEELRKQ